MTSRVLVVCTANVCRSPVAERLLQRRLGGVADAERPPWVVRSAGTSTIRAAFDQRTHIAAAALGVDLSDHVPRHLDRQVLDDDGADLVVTMTREHLRTVVAIDQGAWGRTFTLKEFVRRALEVAPATAAEDLGDWLSRVAQGRRAADMLRPDPLDDLADPYGGPQREHDAMVAEIDGLIDRLVGIGPWRRAVTNS